jgi:SAM-dependent methyltransferase
VSTANLAQNKRYYDSIAAEYDEQMGAASGIRWTRDAFREFVTVEVPTPAAVLDFGCGTGIDTAWLAARGYRVIGYDISTGMLEELRRKCARFIEGGQVSTCDGSFATLIAALDARAPVDAVIANFAVFNLIEDLAPVFSALAPHVKRDGHVFLNILNPIFWKDLRSRVLWAAWARSIGRPSIQVMGGAPDLYRHWVASVRRAARPHFTLNGRASVGALVRRVRGSHTWQSPTSLAERIERRTWTVFPMTRLGQFFFLNFQRSE